MLKQISKKN